MANCALKTVLDLVHAENGLSSCPKGKGYKEEFQSGLFIFYFLNLF